MKKFSRENGWMWLRSFASGDGSISFIWVRDADRSGASLDELVTESDVSEFLREEEAESPSRWAGWDIINMGEGRIPNIKLARNVERPFHTSAKLIMDGKTYRYACDQRVVDSMGAGLRHDGRTTAFYEGRSKGMVWNAGTVLSLCFFLNNERAFCRRDARRKA
jgi:hypothetical protein